jgi:outer membrane biosynthesis protein TonB
MYSAKGPPEGMQITIATPNGTEQHTVGSSYLSYPGYKFRTGEHAYISAQNQGKSGKVTVGITCAWGGNGNVEDVKVEKTESTSTGAYSIATASWTVGDTQQKR